MCERAIWGKVQNSDGRNQRTVKFVETSAKLGKNLYCSDVKADKWAVDATQLLLKSQKLCCDCQQTNPQVYMGQKTQKSQQSIKKELNQKTDAIRLQDLL